MTNELEKYGNHLPSASSLNSALEDAASIITKNYLQCLENYEILEPSEEIKNTDITEISNFYKLTKLVWNKEENFLSKLTTIVNVAFSIGCSLATIIQSGGSNVNFYLGIITKALSVGDSGIASNAKAFQGSVLGNLIGSEIHEVSRTEMEQFRKYLLSPESRSISSVSGVVAMRNKDAHDVSSYVQGIENMVDSLRGKKYTVIMIADPVDTSKIQQIKTGYETIYTQLSTFARNVVTFSENEMASLSSARTEGIAKGISEGIALTQSRTNSISKTRSFHANIGVNIGVLATAGFQGGSSRSTSDTAGRSDSKMESKMMSRSIGSSVSTSKTSGKSLQLSSENRSVKSLLDKIDKHLIRLDECDSFGAFDCAAYVIAEDKYTALTVAGNYNALMRGTDSGVQSSHINLWHDPAKTQILSQYLAAMYHPRLIKDDNRRSTQSSERRSDEIIVTPATIISGSELSMQVGLPKKSITGVTVIPMAPFGRNVCATPGDKISLGLLYHMGSEEINGKTVDIDIQSLAAHTFITGSTGAGKTTVISSMLDKLSEKRIKFLVIEPAKGEYKDKFGSREDVSVYGTNSAKMPLLRINPFSFPEDLHVLEHIDRLMEIFNVCWPLYAAMPAILKDSVERAYYAAGWNLETSKCKYSVAFGRPVFPTFVDVLNQINAVMDESLYSADSKGDYKGALCTRIRSLTNGLYSQIFSSDEISSEKLFDENVIVDLSRTGSGETKSFIMGLLVMKLQEYRMSKSENHNSLLKHVTVLEEAHHILKRIRGSESTALAAKSVEMLANAVAEMRTYGEGFLIADQSPGLMDMSVIRNTNTKILLRLPDLGDRELVGRAANLSEEQIIELSRLKTFVAAVYQNDWLEPVLCHADHSFKDKAVYSYQADSEAEETEIKFRFLNYLMIPRSASSLYIKQIPKMRELVYKMTIPVEAKIAFIRFTEEGDVNEKNSLKARVLYHIFNAELAFGLAKNKREDIDTWYRYMVDTLEPSIRKMEAGEQKKIISLLLNEEMKRCGQKEYQKLMDNLVKYIDRA